MKSKVYYTVKLYSKYNFSNHITLNEVEEDDLQIIRMGFEKKNVINRANGTKLYSSIDLSCFSYIEYNEIEEDIKEK